MKDGVLATGLFPAAFGLALAVGAGWVMDDPNPSGIAGWGHLAERVFKDVHESLGRADDAPPDGA